MKACSYNDLYAQDKMAERKSTEEAFRQQNIILNMQRSDYERRLLLEERKAKEKAENIGEEEENRKSKRLVRNKGDFKWKIRNKQRHLPREMKTLTMQ